MKENIKEELIPLLRKEIERLDSLLSSIREQKEKLSSIIQELEEESIDDTHQKYDMGKSVATDIVNKSIKIFEEGQETLKKLRKKFTKALES